jgi:deoxyribodipyrimidine photo-lyase
MTFEQLATDPRVTIRWPGAPDPSGEAVVYWMQRAQRARDNPALDTAIDLANLLHKPVVVFFGLHPFVTRASLRHYRFLVDGLPDVAAELAARRVGFVLRTYPHHRLMTFLRDVRPAMLIGDENPLRQQEQWRSRIAEEVQVPFWTIDADVIVPSQLIPSEQYAARTIRPRIHRALDEYLVAPAHPVARVAWAPETPVSSLPVSADILDGLPIDRCAAPVALGGGPAAARHRLHVFLKEGLDDYETRRNHPETLGTSQLSPYLHFGQIGPREVAMAVKSSGKTAASVAAFLEQLIVRRELGVNFVRFNAQYDSFEGGPGWARQALRRHQTDPRPHCYAIEAFEAGATHDPLWNAAQRQMTSTGWMHGYMRMYWAKKILEWSATPEEAFETTVRLNDRYELDGRDPSGYANIAWAIVGRHDRPWPARPVFGTVRSMSTSSTSRKFDAARYIAMFGPEASGR